MFKFGKDVLESTNTDGKKYCPICNTDISEKIKDILKDYQGYFDNTYENFIRELKQKINDVSTTIASVEQYESNATKLEKFSTKYQGFLDCFLLERYYFSNIKAELKNLENSLKSKKDNIQNSFDKPQNIESNITALNYALSSFQKFKNDTLKLGN